MVSERIEKVLSRLLLVGVILCGAIVAFGLALLILNPAARVPSDLRDAIASIVELNPYGIIDLGIAILIATPVARVVVSLVHFARIRDMTFVWVTTYVLLVVLLSTLFGLG